MLISEMQLVDTPIMSLQTGKELARTSSAIINPRNLSIIAYRVYGPLLTKDPSYLRVADIRELGGLGFIVDSNDEFLESEDIINHKDIYEMDFKLNGKHVVDDTKQKIGKVSDYIIDIDSFIIEQIIVKRPLLKSLSEDELIVHRSQIIEVTDDLIIIRSNKIKSSMKAKTSRHYVNPFRSTTPQPEAIHPQNTAK